MDKQEAGRRAVCLEDNSVSRTWGSRLGVHCSSCSRGARLPADRGGVGARLEPLSSWRAITSGVSPVPRGDKIVLSVPRASSASRQSSRSPYTMPFVRYLLHDGREVVQDDNHQFDANFPTHPAHSSEASSQPSSSNAPVDPSPLQFQLPYFMAFGSPTVALGGGAEVLPFQPTDDPSPKWLSDSFSPFSPVDP